MKKLFLLLSLALAAVSACLPAKAGAYRLDVVTDPATVPVGKANILLTVTDPQGTPVEDAQVRAIARMPGMNMGEREQPARAGSKPGVYVVPAVFSMPGLYEVTVTVNDAPGTFELRTGQNTAEQSPNRVPQIVGGAAGFALLGFVLYRVRKTGQRLDPASVLNRKVLGSMILLASALAAAIWAVNNLRRPGAMTPIESQAMEMNTPAPEGTRPLRLVTASRRTFEETVTYSGQAVGFVEQLVTARVPGTVQALTVYTGDRVTKGALLVRLDTTQLDPEVAMKDAAVGRAQEGVGVAALEYQESLDDVRLAKAESGMAESELAEARAMLAAIEQGRAQAESEVRAAEAEVAAAEAVLAAAQADRTYTRAELERSQALFDKAALSRDELQRARADAQKAEAMVRGAGEQIRKARAMVASAQAARRRSEAEAVAAERRVGTVSASLSAKQAAVQKALTQTEAAKARIGQERAMVREAAASLQGAANQRRYSQIRAEFDGVVTERPVGPGQLVTAGQTILKVAQTNPMRVQANVTQADLAKVRVGADVRFFVGGEKGGARKARITSVAPAVDPATRTGIVEALVPNPELVLRPGQFVVMEIVVGVAPDAIVIPRDAVVIESQVAGNAGSEERAFVWVATPTPNGEFQVLRQPVRTGPKSGTEVAILDGLSSGDRVVASPPADLRETHRVVASDPPEEAADTTILVTERGYEPATVTIDAEKPAVLTFLRKADPSCGDTLVFQGLGIRKSLPHNVPVRIEIPPQPKGEIRFACGMDMYRGKVVVR